MTQASEKKNELRSPPARPSTGLFKKVITSRAFRSVLCVLAILYIRLVHATSRWSIINDETPRRFWDAGEPFILAFWHGRLLLMPYCWRSNLPMNMLISQHRDGELIANVISQFGLKSVRGSAGDARKGGTKRAKGGATALRTLARLAAAGEALGITPDGPRGPRMRAGEGIAALARLTGLPVIPAACATSRRRVLNTWDRFVLALPFSRATIIWGEPIALDRHSDAAEAETVRLRIEDELNRVTREADARVGAPAIDPAPKHEPHLLEAEAS